MVFKKIFVVMAILLVVISMAGCGDEGNSNTNGTLKLGTSVSVNKPAVGLTATTTVTPVKVGALVNISVSQYGYNSSTGLFEVIDSYSESKSTDITGTAVFDHNFQQSPNMSTTLEVTASIGGLHQTVRIPVDKFVP